MFTYYPDHSKAHQTRQVLLLCLSLFTYCAYLTRHSWALVLFWPASWRIRMANWHNREATERVGLGILEVKAEYVWLLADAAAKSPPLIRSSSLNRIKTLACMVRATQCWRRFSFFFMSGFFFFLFLWVFVWLPTSSTTKSTVTLVHILERAKN